LQSVLENAEKRGRKHHWLEASKLYEQALGVVDETDFLRKEGVGFEPLPKNSLRL